MSIEKVDGEIESGKFSPKAAEKSYRHRRESCTPSMHTDTREPGSAQIFVSPTSHFDATKRVWTSEGPTEEASPHSAHREEQADRLRMQQVTAATPSVRELPGRPGPPGPPPGLSGSGGEGGGTDQGGEEKRGQERGKRWRVKQVGGEEARRGGGAWRHAPSQHSDYHSAIIREGDPRDGGNGRGETSTMGTRESQLHTSTRLFNAFFDGNKKKETKRLFMR